MVMGGIVPVLNVAGIAPGQLVLDGPTLAKSFLGEVKTWNDPAIAKLNPSAKLPSKAILVVHRSDGSGTTFNFTNYLDKVSPEWKTKVGSNTSVEWPVGIGAKGNEGVSNNVGQAQGTIGFVEYAYAKQNKLTYTKMINKDGKTVSPTSGDGGDVDPDAQAAAGLDGGVRSAPVLRVSLCSRGQDGRGTRLCADAGERRHLDREGLVGRDQGRELKASLHRNALSILSGGGRNAPPPSRWVPGEPKCLSATPLLRSQPERRTSWRAS
jgi:periplasmic binding family protein